MAEHTAIIMDLLDIGAVQIRPEDPFTWTSGIKSPIYCDNRLTMSYPEVRKKIKNLFVERIREVKPAVDVIAGCATAGIPHAAFIAEAMDLPMVYVRSSAKKHGKGNQIEGMIHPGDRVIVIEDLISTGQSSIQAAEALREAGADVIEVMAIFSYGLPKAEEAFQQAGFRYQTLTGFQELIRYMKANGQLDEKAEAKLEKWQKEPAAY
ncbi:orotate phosphoribosyltransferase [Thalassobacillus cyri]|uniref:Orotate phosphoribosyltransferase n=1 Tax=Thalassobacillus cyri TaxID=571932 RepID=A0A1H4H723_9BACI|nr:orotate phosphoribosyltransferase [Thalassobacillus cyri]SEB17584.1 orotate phosphoribosyltransferase [Thalassobacillus cyri]